MKRSLVLILICFLLASCGKQPEPISDEPVLVKAGAYTLADGTVVDLWQTDLFVKSVYRTADGVELLRFRDAVDIANVHTANFDDFNALDPMVQERIRSYYDENWPNPDIKSMLENAWSDYSAMDQTEDFSVHYAEQSIFPCAANDSFLAYCIESVIPVESSIVRNEYFCTVFDRRIGEVINFWDMFSVTKAQASDYLAQKLAENGSQYPEIRSALDGKAVFRILQGGIEILFPQGTLSWADLDHYVYLDCAELADILHPWAVTDELE